MKDYILEQLSTLTSIPSPSGYTQRITDHVMGKLRDLGYQPECSNKGNVIVTLGGTGKPLVLSAHLDTLGAMVRKIKDNGRLLLSAAISGTPATVRIVRYIPATAVPIQESY